MVYGIDQNWLHDLAIGFGAGLGFIALNLLSPSIAIGIPSVPFAAISDRFIIIVLLAPLAEELAFRAAFFGVLEKWTRSLLAGVLVSAAAFALAHFFAYGIALSAALFGAFIFGVVAALLVKYTKNVLATIAMHSTFNLYLGIRLAQLVIVGVA